MTEPLPYIPFEALSLTPARYDGFIFDCDGTLADTMPLHYRAWLHALRESGVAFDFHWELFLSRAGMSLERTVEELNAQFSTNLEPAEVAASQRRFFESELDMVLPIPEVVELARLVCRQHRASVASGSTYQHVIRTLELIGVRSCFDVIVTPSDVVHGKPAPDMFLLAAERMAVPPERCLVIEDSLLGVEAAKHAGMHAALVPSTRVEHCPEKDA